LPTNVQLRHNSYPVSPPPILLGLARDRWRLRIFDLHPMRRRIRNSRDKIDSAPGGGNSNRCSDREFAFSRLGAVTLRLVKSALAGGRGIMNVLRSVFA